MIGCSIISLRYMVDRGRLILRREKFYSSHVGFETPIRYANRDIKLAARDMNMELRNILWEIGSLDYILN